MSATDYSIKDLDKVIEVDGAVKNTEISRLTAPGENYLSLVLKVDIDVEKNGKQSTIHAVAKKVPSVKSHMGDMNVLSMKNEIKFYLDIVSLLTEFSSEYGVDSSYLYPKYYGSRLSLDPNETKPDKEAMLLLENLHLLGYKNEDRHVGFDLISSKAILKSLALFHAIPIALREKQPEKFEAIKTYLINSRPSFDKPPSDGPSSGPPRPEFPEGKGPHQLIFKAMQNIPECQPYIEQIRPSMEKPMGPGDFMGKSGTEPWATIGHSDFWVNNVMIKPQPGEEPLVKIIDFQVCGYKSYANDLVFFLLTSVCNPVQLQHMDDLLLYYYEEFMKNLKTFEVELDLDYDDYLKEVEKTAKEGEVKHALFFTTPILAEKNSSVDVTTQELDMPRHMTRMIENMGQLQKDKLAVIIPEICKRNWI